MFLVPIIFIPGNVRLFVAFSENTKAIISTMPEYETKKKIRIRFWFTAVVPIVIYAPIKYYNGPERLICQATSTSGCRNKQGPREKSQSCQKPSILLPIL